jgi:phospholipid/cholesterol/gamma-HCH transport system substrate-binding protein
MVLDATVQIPDDTAAKITASGLLGDNFIALTPGSSEYMLEAGEEITYTQGSVNLLDIATKAIAGNGTDSGASD